MAAGDINDPLSQIPGIALADDTNDPTDLGAGYALLKFKSGKLVWLPTGGTVKTALALGAVSQIAGLTAEAAPLDTDLFLMERASDGALRKVQAQNLPGGTGTGGGIYSASACIVDQKAQNTAGGGASALTWNARDLNTELWDPDSIVTISANKFVPIAGNYELEAFAPAYAVQIHRLRLYNVTTATVVGYGENAYARDDSSVFNHARLLIRFTTNGTDEYRIEHYTNSATPTNGLGVVSNQSTEQYTTVHLRKLAA